jgi:protein kinase A
MADKKATASSATGTTADGESLTKKRAVENATRKVSDF